MFYIVASVQILAKGTNQIYFCFDYLQYGKLMYYPEYSLTTYEKEH